MKLYLCSVWAIYFQICVLIRANNKREAKDILCKHYQARYPKIELENISAYEVDKLKFTEGLYEISRSD
jgi:hypothetical protein